MSVVTCIFCLLPLESNESIVIALTEDGTVIAFHDNCEPATAQYRASIVLHSNAVEELAPLFEYLVTVACTTISANFQPYLEDLAGIPELQPAIDNEFLEFSAIAAMLASELAKYQIALNSQRLHMVTPSTSVH